MRRPNVMRDASLKNVWESVADYAEIENDDIENKQTSVGTCFKRKADKETEFSYLFNALRSDCIGNDRVLDYEDSGVVQKEEGKIEKQNYAE